MPNHALLATRSRAQFLDDLPDDRRRLLLEDAKSGDALAFARLFDSFADRVYQYMQLHLRDEQVAEDLTARVYLKAWRSIPCYAPERMPFNVWIYLIARKALMEFQNTQRGMGIAPDLLSPTEEGLPLHHQLEPCSEARTSTDN